MIERKKQELLEGTSYTIDHYDQKAKNKSASLRHEDFPAMHGYDFAPQEHLAPIVPGFDGQGAQVEDFEIDFDKEHPESLDLNEKVPFAEKPALKTETKASGRQVSDAKPLVAEKVVEHGIVQPLKASEKAASKAAPPVIDLDKEWKELKNFKEHFAKPKLHAKQDLEIKKMKQQNEQSAKKEKLPLKGSHETHEMPEVIHGKTKGIDPQAADKPVVKSDEPVSHLLDMHAGVPVQDHHNHTAHDLNLPQDYSDKPAVNQT